MATDTDASTTTPRTGPLGRGLGALVGRLAEPVYRYEITRRNRAFDAGKGVTRLDRPVISVGNLSVGGTGKTPLVAKLVRELIAAGKRPCIAMRGYARRRGASGISDEAEEYATLLPGVSVVAQPDRIAGLRALFATPAGADVDVVVLDDGFQHRRIAREVDIVLIDASAGTLEDRLLPAGWLREPVASLARAHAVVVTHVERAPEGEVERIRRAVERVNPALAFAECRHAWGELVGGPEGADVGWLRGRRVVAVCAIGNPAAFLSGVRAAGAEVVEEIVLPDHDPFGRGPKERMLRATTRHRAEAIVCTEKDWTKIGPRGSGEIWDCPVVRPRVELRFDKGWDEVWGLVPQAVGAKATAPTLSVSAGVGG